jgi:hypothetical protein
MVMKGKWKIQGISRRIKGDLLYNGRLKRRFQPSVMACMAGFDIRWWVL